MRTPQEINRQRAESVANIIGGLTEIQQFLEKNGFITGYSEGILTGAKILLRPRQKDYENRSTNKSCQLVLLPGVTKRRGDKSCR